MRASLGMNKRAHGLQGHPWEKAAFFVGENWSENCHQSSGHQSSTVHGVTELDTTEARSVSSKRQENAFAVWAAKKRKGLKALMCSCVVFFKKIFICLFGCTGSLLQPVNSCAEC